MADIFNMLDTWNAIGTTFTGIKLNVTDTASAAGSLLMDLQVGGSSKFKVDKSGAITALTATSSSPHNFNADGSGRFGFYQPQSFVFGFGYNSSQTGTLSPVFQMQGSSRFILNSGLEFCWSATTGSSADGDLKLHRDAANTLAQRNGVNAQAFNLYGTYTDGSNYRRIKTTMSTAGVAEIKPEGAGTGVSGNVLHISGLPTANPGAGILWNNLGAVVVGT